MIILTFSPLALSTDETFNAQKKSPICNNTMFLSPRFHGYEEKLHFKGEIKHTVNNTLVHMIFNRTERKKVFYTDQVAREIQ